MLNKAMLIGRLGKDPDVRQGVTTFSVATDESYTDRSGQRVDRTEWHSIVTYGKTAEACGQHIAKGSLVYVEGRLRTRKWTDRSGADRYTTEIHADRVQFLDRRQETQEQRQPQKQAYEDMDEAPF